MDRERALKNYLAAKSGGKNAPWLGVLHRLDQPVEGVIVFAKTSAASANINRQDVYKRQDFDTILQESDVLSIHAPLNSQTENLIDLQALKKMKPTSVLINVARGPIVNQEDLYTALTQNMIAGAGLDVLKQEPMRCV